MNHDSLRVNVNTGQWLPSSTYPAQTLYKKLNHRVSTSVEASNPNTWSSYRFFMGYELLAPPVRVTLTHTNSCNKIRIVYLSLLHVVFQDFEAYQPCRQYVSHAPKFIYPATVIIIRKAVNKHMAYIHHIIIHTCSKLGAPAQYTTISNVNTYTCTYIINTGPPTTTIRTTTASPPPRPANTWNKHAHLLYIETHQ